MQAQSERRPRTFHLFYYFHPTTFNNNNNNNNMTITLYPAIVYDNNLSLDHGGAEVDEACEQIINTATKGWGVSHI